jgi:hypothetical protein
MTQREQNGNCFCSRAAMRQQQSLMMSCDTLVAPRHILASLTPRLGRFHKFVIGSVSFSAAERKPTLACNRASAAAQTCQK